LRAHSWPGNVRELKNVVQRAFIVADSDIDENCLPASVSNVSAKEAAEVSVGLSIEEARRRLILSTLESCGGNKKKAAELLGISLKTLYNRLGAYKDNPVEPAKPRRVGRTPASSTRRLDDGADDGGRGDGLQETGVEPGGERPSTEIGLGEGGHRDRR
jgi:DNA-binding protein Fis